MYNDSPYTITDWQVFWPVVDIEIYHVLRSKTNATHRSKLIIYTPLSGQKRSAQVYFWPIGGNNRCPGICRNSGRWRWLPGTSTNGLSCRVTSFAPRVSGTSMSIPLLGITSFPYSALLVPHSRASQSPFRRPFGGIRFVVRCWNLP